MAIQSNFPAIKPSLLLDFANTKQLDPRITFTRASTATYYDGVTTAKAEQNLLTYSQDFANANWTLYYGTLTVNSVVAPDGTTTADTLTPSGQYASVVQNAATIVGQQYTYSVWVKRATGSNVMSLYNAATGTDILSFTPTASWVRYSATFTATTALDAIYIQDRNASGWTAWDMWGAQLEQRSAVTAYTATTTQAITNFIPVLQTAASGVARFDNNPTTGESLGLLIEESRTNLLTYSDDFTNASWSKTESTIVANTVVAPDGTLTGDKLVESTSVNASHQVYKGTTLTAASYTFSFYAKAAERTWCAIYFDPAFSVSYVNLSNGAVGTVAAGYTVTVASVGNGWYRIAATRTGTAATWYTVIETATGDLGRSYTGNGFSGIYIWGAQLELGSFATSYIPTVASQVTRAADAASMTGTNFSSWFNNGEGTIYTDFTRLTLVSSSQFSISDGTNTNYIQSVSSGTGAFEQAIISTNGTIVFNYGPTAVLSGKIVMAYKFNDSAASLNAATATTDTSVTIPAVNQLSIANSTTNNRLNGTIKKLAYYPIRVTNTQLQALTS